ncbi:hypothetical protein QPM17_11420 [Marinobacter sp. TBZ242]|uniref:Uncharacterized protein n=1 Tax=Marinobacter azerbaijanicus TaxID=3050455 RepID=A0ABT7ID72_9GAMM|nr:hypothetical protein [Marinobacter sp. TBZ242]MDL0431742.1 hypothetical protein [Marinobacter sp. TBZ242]
MNSTGDSLEKLAQAQRRYGKFRELFREFQQNLSFFHGDRFPLKGIGVDHKDGELSNLSFLNRDYCIEFSMVCMDGVLKGSITFYRLIDEQTKNLLQRATFNGQGELDVKPTPEGDPMSIDEDSSCMGLVLDWLRSEVYS